MLAPRKFSMRLSPIRVALKTFSLEEWFWRLVFVGALSGMVYCEIATRTLDTASPVTRRGRREEKSRGWKRQSLVSRPQNHEPSHAVKILRQLLTFVKGIGPLKCPIETFIYSGISLKVSRCSPTLSQTKWRTKRRRRTRPEAPLSRLLWKSSHENSVIRESPCGGFTRSVCAYPPIPI